MAYMPHQQYQQQNQGGWGGATSPPMTSFPAPMSYGNARTTKGLPPMEINVHSVWEKDEVTEPSIRKSKTDKGRGCCGGRKKTNVTKQEKKKRSRLMCLICIGILILVALITALAVTISRKHKDNGSTSTVQWLNLTGYPPMPTGQMNVAQPTLLAKVDGCTDPTTLWSCDLPKEAQQGNLPGGPDQPSFSVEIRFSNDTISNKTLTKPLRFKRDLGGSPFTPSPSPPSEEDQIFLGNTTDHNVEPFQGEDTPFFISFLSTSEESAAKIKVKRDSTVTHTTAATTSTSTANLATIIPTPSVLDDGTAAPANLFPSPLPTSQPLKLYNRGTDKEHYGFYTYFDRSIFLKSVHVNNVSDVDPGQVHADQNGGSTKDGATARCTWTETRFLVQIWTRAQAPLLDATTNGTSGGTADARPGSFPYPITVTTDRHGGTPTGKMIYCYALDENERPVPLNKTLMFENRGFEGTLVNGGTGPFGGVVVDPSKGGPGGMDGGSGGCGCRWGNWMDSNKL